MKISISAFLVSLEGSLNELPEENEIRYLTKPPMRKDAVDRSFKFAEASELGGGVNEIQSQSMSYQQTLGTDFTPGYMVDATPSGMIAEEVNPVLEEVNQLLG